jgi:hypothetical protein
MKVEPKFRQTISNDYYPQQYFAGPSFFVKKLGDHQTADVHMVDQFGLVLQIAEMIFDNRFTLVTRFLAPYA